MLARAANESGGGGRRKLLLNFRGIVKRNCLWIPYPFLCKALAVLLQPSASGNSVPFSST
jgi:hypothetical protein